MPPRSTTTNSSDAASLRISSTVSSRRSTRTRIPPVRFNPSSQVPTELSDMIRKIAATQAEKSQVPLEAGAVQALEQALEKVLTSLLSVAQKHAASENRDTIELEDLNAAKQQFKINTSQVE